MLDLNFWISISIIYLWSSLEGRFFPLLTGRIRKETLIDKNGALIITALPNKIILFQANSFIDNLDIKLDGLVPYLYPLFSHSIHDYFYLVSLELQLADWKYSQDQNQKDKIADYAQFFGIKESDIDFDRTEIIDGLSNMSKGAICEASRLYEQNYSQFNLPPQVQVAALEDTIRLQSVGYLLESHDDFFEEQQVDDLTKSLCSVFELHKTFEELCDCIHEVQENKNPGQYFYHKKSPAIRNNLYSFVIEPLRRMRYVYDTYSTGNILTKRDAFDAHQKRIKWLQDIQQIAKKTSSSKTFQKLKTSFYAGQIPYEDFLNSAPYMLYQLNEKYKEK